MRKINDELDLYEFDLDTEIELKKAGVEHIADTDMYLYKKSSKGIMIWLNSTMPRPKIDSCLDIDTTNEIELKKRINVIRTKILKINSIIEKEYRN